MKAFTVDTEGVSPSTIHVVYNGVDLERYGPHAGDPRIVLEAGIPPDVPVVGIVANLRPVKDIELFIRSAAIVRKVAPAARFVIVGRGELRQSLADLVGSLGIANSVVFADGAARFPITSGGSRSDVFRRKAKASRMHYWNIWLRESLWSRQTLAGTLKQ